MADQPLWKIPEQVLKILKDLDEQMARTDRAIGIDPNASDAEDQRCRYALARFPAWMTPEDYWGKYDPGDLGALLECAAEQDRINKTLVGHFDKPSKPKPSRSTKPERSELRKLIKEFRQMGLSQIEQCRELDSRRMARPSTCGWSHLTYTKAFLDTVYGNAVKKWLSTMR